MNTSHLDCRRRAAEQLLASGHVGRGLTLLHEVLAEMAVRVPDTPADALASMQATRDALRPALGLPAPAAAASHAAAPPPPPPVAFVERAASQVSPARLRVVDVLGATSIGLILVDNVRGADFQARALAAALDAGEPRRIVRALVFEAIYRAQEGAAGRREAEHLARAARAVAAGRGDPHMDAYLSLAVAFLSYYHGRYRQAVIDFRAAAERFRGIAGVAWEQNTIRLHILRAIDYQGAWGELRTLYDEYLRDARRRDDRYVEASLSRWFNVLWLAHDDPDRAGADLDRTVWSPPAEGRYHLQHFLELRARVELALYRGDGASQGAWARPGLDAAERSLLLRIQVAQAIADWLRGRIAACEAAAWAGRASPPDAARRAAAVAEVDARADALDAQDIGYARIWAGLLRGAARAASGDVAGAVAGLIATADVADRHDFPLCATVARLRAAQLRGPAGAADAAAAAAWMRGQDIYNPLRMAEVFAPGYGKIPRSS